MKQVNPIAVLNDRFRQGDRQLGKFVMTVGVSDLSSVKLNQLLHLVRSFDQFTPDNDPYEEHDFGKVTVNGENYYFKIDYFDLSYKYHSNDPANPQVTRRVLTLMRADEY
jgi:hypothetical protein